MHAHIATFASYAILLGTLWLEDGSRWPIDDMSNKRNLTTGLVHVGDIA